MRYVKLCVYYVNIIYNCMYIKKKINTIYKYKKMEWINSVPYKKIKDILLKQ